MIFAIYPLALAIRATNVYEEKALGIQESTEFDTAHGLEHLKQEEGYVGLHFKEQLAVSCHDRFVSPISNFTSTLPCSTMFGTSSSQSGSVSIILSHSTMPDD
jgi:hypothetical protein